MGCWDGTDFLTQLPIRAGEKVRLVFITESPYKDESQRNLAGYCYTTGMYFPRGIPIRGEYNDYGGIDDIVPSFAHERMIAAFKEDCVPSPFNHERDKYVDRNSLDPEKITFEYVLDRAQEGCLNVYDGHSDKLSKYEHEVWDAKIKNADALISGRKSVPVPEKPVIDDRRKLAVGYVLIREDMYQAMLNTTIPKRWSNDEVITKQNYHDAAKTFLEKLRKHAVELEVNDVRRAYRKLFSGLDASGERNMFTERISIMSGIPFQRNLSDFSDFIYEQVEAGVSPDDPKIVELVAEMADFMFFTTCLDYARKGWHPQTGAGSQNDEVAVQASLARAVLKHAEEVMAQREKEEKEYQAHSALGLRSASGVAPSRPHGSDTFRRLAADVQPPDLLCGNLHRSQPFSRNLLSCGELAVTWAYYRARQERSDQ